MRARTGSSARSASPPPASLEGEIRFETLRSSGPGGQHVNTTDSAVRATHLASGISVRVQSQRSQHANKRLAILLIARRLADQASSAADALRAERRRAHGRISAARLAGYSAASVSSRPERLSRRALAQLHWLFAPLARGSAAHADVQRLHGQEKAMAK